MDKKKLFDTISSFDQLEELYEQYEKKYGIEAFNLSYWDPSDDFFLKMLPYIQIEFPQNAINYVFTYQIENLKNKLLADFGFNPQIKDAIITPNGTSSIMIVIHWLKMNGFSKLNVICPSYFSLFNNCQKENIEIIKHPIDYRTGDFLGINPKDYHNEIFWITNPIYSLGHHIEKNHQIIIEELLKENVVIVDDCVAQKNKELSHLYGNHKNFMGIYAPHKSVCINGLKFSMIVFNKDYEPFFDQSIDFLCGGLNIASVAAINSYLDGSFDVYRNKFQQNIKETHVFIKKICEEIPHVYYNNADEHYLSSILFPNIPYELGGNKSFLWNIMDNTGGSFITGHFNNYPPESGFSFRVNLARDSILFRSTLVRLLLFLSKEANSF